MANLFTPFAKTAEKVLGDTDLSPAMIYMVDVVNANALPFLADQFDVLGFKGWDLALTEKQQRELIKTSIAIKRHIGTPYAIKQALKAIGYENVTIQEGVMMSSIFYDAEYTYNGAVLHGGFNWASFIVTIKTKSPDQLSNKTKELIENLINYYKNARSKLYALNFLADGYNYYDSSNKHDGLIAYM